MDNLKRKELLKSLLIDSNEPIKGQDLADKFKVTRQVIVKDIAILRAEGLEIISTPKGYMVLKVASASMRRVIAVNHTSDQMEDELNTIVKYGGIVEDVIVEHPLYGEIRGMLMLKNMYDIENFCISFKNYSAEPLSTLTNGVHLHTIVCDSENSLKKIIDELSKKGYLIKEL